MPSSPRRSSANGSTRGGVYSDASEHRTSIPSHSSRQSQGHEEVPAPGTNPFNPAIILLATVVLKSLELLTALTNLITAATGMLTSLIGILDRSLPGSQRAQLRAAVRDIANQSLLTTSATSAAGDSHRSLENFATHLTGIDQPTGETMNGLPRAASNRQMAQDYHSMPGTEQDLNYSSRPAEPPIPEAVISSLGVEESSSLSGETNPNAPAFSDTSSTPLANDEQNARKALQEYYYITRGEIQCNRDHFVTWEQRNAKANNTAWTCYFVAPCGLYFPAGRLIGDDEEKHYRQYDEGLHWYSTKLAAMRAASGLAVDSFLYRDAGCPPDWHIEARHCYEEPVWPVLPLLPVAYPLKVQRITGMSRSRFHDD